MPMAFTSVRRAPYMPDAFYIFLVWDADFGASRLVICLSLRVTDQSALSTSSFRRRYATKSSRDNRGRAFRFQECRRVRQADDERTPCYQ